MAALPHRIGDTLRRLADRIDHPGAPKATQWTFTFEDREGVRIRRDGKGCRLWYLNNDEYERAHDEADTKHARVNWGELDNSRLRRSVFDENQAMTVRP